MKKILSAYLSIISAMDNSYEKPQIWPYAKFKLLMLNLPVKTTL